MAADVDKLVFVAVIYEAQARSQTFGQVRDCYIRVVNASTQAEIARFDLTQDAPVETGMVFGEVYRDGAEWRFHAVGQGYADGVAGIFTEFGVPFG